MIIYMLNDANTVFKYGKHLIELRVVNVVKNENCQNVTKMSQWGNQPASDVNICNMASSP
jgi:hypothetical protein